MATVENLQEIAGHCGGTAFERLLEIALRHEWTKAEGLTYALISLSQAMRAVKGPHVAKTIPSPTEDIELAVVRVTETLEPHRHMDSDVVVIVEPGFEPNIVVGSLYTEADGWHPLIGGQVVTIPKGLVHGFKPLLDSDALLLIDLSHPPLKDEDVEYM